MTQGLELRGAILGKGYRLGRRLDTDDTSAFEATHERIPGRFIVRVFPPESLSQPESSSRIQRGARVASLLRDPHAVQVLDCNASGEMPAFVVIERIPGKSLAEVMAEDEKLPLPRVVELVESIALALTAGHQIGLVHGDLRPAHIILPTSGQPPAKLSGFGWAKELRAAARSPAPSGYLAPEQQVGKVVSLDERADQYGLSALAYEMITAALPFPDDNGTELDPRRVPAPPSVTDLVPAVPRAVDEVLRRGLAPHPGDRFGTVLELASRLRSAMAETAPQSAGVDRTRSAPASDVADADADGDQRLVGATPAAPSNDVTEELDLSNLSPVEDEDEVTSEHAGRNQAGSAVHAAAGVPIEQGRSRSQPGHPSSINEADRDGDSEGDDIGLDPEDADLVLGGARGHGRQGSTGSVVSDDAKTQIVRSPFFQEPHETEEERPEARQRARREFQAERQARHADHPDQDPAEEAGHADGRAAAGGATAHGDRDDERDADDGGAPDDTRTPGHAATPTPMRGIPLGRPPLPAPPSSPKRAALSRTLIGVAAPTGLSLPGGPPPASGARLAAPASTGTTRAYNKTKAGIGPQDSPGTSVFANVSRFVAGRRVAVTASAGIGLVVLAGAVWLFSRDAADPEPRERAASVEVPPSPSPAGSTSAAPTTASPPPPPTPQTPAAPLVAATTPASAASTTTEAAPPSSPAAPASVPGATSRPQPLASAPGAGRPPVAPANRLPEGEASSEAAGLTPPLPRTQANRPVVARRPPPVKRPAPAARPLAASNAASRGDGEDDEGADDAAATECSIRISSRPWAEVWLDGKDTGRKTPIDKLKVPCGTRKLELKRPDKDIEQMEMLEVVPGKPYRGSYELE